MEVFMEELNNNTGIETGTDEGQETKTFTYEEVMALIQSESDKRTNQALAKQKKQYEKQLSLSKLDGDEREKAEKDSKIAELEQMIAEMNVERNKSELKSVLSSRGLSAEFCDILNITDNIEESQANIDKLDKLFKAAVRTEVEKRLAGNAPKGNGGSSTNEITKEEARKMSMADRQALFTSNPELYKKLFN
jgi:NADH dehydrogenase/NADH:ubiquinone oxidoreductase subunit G